MKAIRRFTVRTVLPEPLRPLGELATNLRWSWHPPTRELFESVDPALWRRVDQDPVRLLGEVTSERLAELAGDGDFVRSVRGLAADLEGYLHEPRWYQELPGTPPACIGYFSPEFGITAVLPQYSGGLGILAGDHLKAASDLGVPILGVGLFYRSGYFRQSLSRDGWQQERYPVLDPDGLPLALVREADGAPVKVVIGLPGGRRLAAYVWRAQVGRVPLLLLDSDVEENASSEREVTDRLYGGGSEHRLEQEMLLGIGGVRAIRAFCRITGHPEPEVFHTNEGHAGFLGLERIRELVDPAGAPGAPAAGAPGVGVRPGGAPGRGAPAPLDFDAALEAVRAGTVFTTHTPVPAGIDRFGKDMVRAHFGGDNASPNMPVERILALGAEDYAGGDPSVFNMAVMGLRLGQRANGVSVLHGRVSREMFSGLWPGFDVDEVPIGSVTNGVHAPTWVAPEVFEVASREIGPSLVEEGKGWRAVADVSDEDIWSTKRMLRDRLVHEVRRRLRESWLARGASDAELGWVSGVFDADVLTIGFARRVPSYKRLTLMIRDPERLRRILLHPTRPVQLVIAGKSHPADDGGKRLIQELVRFADDPAVRHRIVFLPDYDIALARVMYPGCDVWLNNPLRPLEACGTSGMKAALNGALNLSVLDGWWDEMFDGENGWAIPTADGIEDPDRRDDLEAHALYELVEDSVASRFYDTGHGDLPVRWIAMVRHTLQTLGPKVLASRMLHDYVERLYAPAAGSARAVAADGHALARDLATWKARVRAAWPGVAIEHVEAVGTTDDLLLGQRIKVRVYATLGGLAPDDVQVQLVHGRVDPDDRIVAPAHLALSPLEALDAGRWRFEAEIDLDRTGPFGYTVRVLPRHAGLTSPAELGLQALPPPTVGLSEGVLR